MIKKITNTLIACGIAWGVLAVLAMGMEKEIARQELINSERELLRMCWAINPEMSKNECLKG